MKSTNYKLILLDDLSDNIENACLFASNFNKAVNIEFIILHVVDKEQEAQMDKENSSINLLFQELQQRAENFSQKYQLNITPRIEKGNIFETIPKFAEKEKADLILFNSPGITKFQKRIGSNAFRLIRNSTIPVAIIHPNYEMTIKKIVYFSTNLMDKYIKKIADIFNVPYSNIEFTEKSDYNNTLLVYAIPKAAFKIKELQKDFEKLIFNSENRPVICLKV